MKKEKLKLVTFGGLIFLLKKNFKMNSHLPILCRITFTYTSNERKRKNYHCDIDTETQVNSGKRTAYTEKKALTSCNKTERSHRTTHTHKLCNHKASRQADTCRLCSDNSSLYWKEKRKVLRECEEKKNTAFVINGQKN